MLCVEYDDTGLENNPGIYTKDALIDATLKRIGFNKLRDKFADFQKSADFASAASFKQHLLETTPAEAQPIQLFDSDFTSFFNSNTDRILKFLKDVQIATPQKPQQQQQPIQQSVAAVDAQAKQAAAAAIRNEDDVLNKYKKMQDKRKQEQEQEIVKHTAKISELQQLVDKLTEEGTKARNELTQKEQLHAQQLSSLQLELHNWQQKYEQKDIEVKSKVKEYLTRCSLAEDQVKKSVQLADQKEKELDNLARAYDQMEQFAREQEAAVTTQKSLVQQAEAKVKQLEGEKSKSDAKIKQLERDLEQAQTANKSTIELLRLELKQAQEELTNKQASASQVDSAVKQVEAEAREWKNKAEQAELANAQLQDMLTGANQKLTLQQDDWKLKVQLQQQVVSEQVSRLESTISEQLSKLSTQKAALDQQTRLVEQLQAQLQQQQQQAAAAPAPAQQSSSNITEQAYMQTMKRLSESTQQVNGLNQRVLALDAELQETKKLVHQRDSRIEELEQDNLDMMDIIEKLEEKLKAAKPQ